MQNEKHLWYIVQIYSAQVDKMVQNIRKIFEVNKVSELMSDIFLPSIKYNAVGRNGKIESKTKLAYGGYMMAKVASITKSDGKYEMDPRVLSSLFKAIGVLKVMKKPMTEEEYIRMKENIEKQNEQVELSNDSKLNVGSYVKIHSGSLKGFSGVIQKVIDDEGDRLIYSVKVKIFDQETSINCKDDEIILNEEVK